jgi:hypothetical protein
MIILNYFFKATSIFIFIIALVFLFSFINIYHNINLYIIFLALLSIATLYNSFVYRWYFLIVEYLFIIYGVIALILGNYIISLLEKTDNFSDLEPSKSMIKYFESLNKILSDINELTNFFYNNLASIIISILLISIFYYIRYKVQMLNTQQNLAPNR